MNRNNLKLDPRRSADLETIKQGLIELAIEDDLPTDWTQADMDYIFLRGALAETVHNELETYRCLALSTGHIQYSDTQLLDELVELSPFFMKREYGYFIKLYADVDQEEYSFLKNGDFEPKLSPSLINVIKFALDHGFMMIELDRDATEVNDLPFFNW